MANSILDVRIKFRQGDLGGTCQGVELWFCQDFKWILHNTKLTWEFGLKEIPSGCHGDQETTTNAKGGPVVRVSKDRLELGC